MLGRGMKRALNLRQIEAFKAVIEDGTVSHAADALFVSQSAVSKLLMNLEEKAGLRQVEQAVGSIRCDEQ